MPYVDPEKHRELDRTLKRARYQSDRDYREAEKERAARNYAKNREKIIARVLKRREMKRLGMV